MNNSELYFLRSSEQFIVTDIINLLEQYASLDIYQEFFGVKKGDIGVYIIVNGEVVGAAWVRLLPSGKAFVDEETPELVLAVKPEHRQKGHAKYLMQQLIYEVSGVFPKMSLNVSKEDEIAVSFFKKLGFEQVKENEDKNTITMLKSLDPNEYSASPVETNLPKDYDKYIEKSYF